MQANLRSRGGLRNSFFKYFWMKCHFSGKLFVDQDSLSYLGIDLIVQG